MTASIHQVTAFEDSGVVLMARVQGKAATNITQSDIDSIAYSVYDLSSTSAATASGSLTVSTVVFNSLQTDARWTADATGYNFRWDVPASILADGGKTYRIEIAFTPASGEVFHLVYEVTTVGLYRS